MLNRRLVGGFNPFEKYARQMGNLPQIGVKIPKIFELPTPSRPWNNPENWHAPKRAIHCHPLCSPSILFFSMATPTYPSCRERNQSITTTHIPQKGSKSHWWNKLMRSCQHSFQYYPWLARFKSRRDNLNQMPSTNCSAPKTNAACYRSQSVSIPVPGDQGDNWATKKTLLLSIESWLFNDGILIMVYNNPKITG